MEQKQEKQEDISQEHLLSLQEEGKLKLNSRWVIWENYKNENYKKQQEQFVDNNKVVTSFDTLEKFSMIWNNTNLSFPTKLFTDKNGVVSKFNINGKNKSIEALAIFRDGIYPTWEDEANAKGADIFYIIYGKDYEKDFSQANQIWQEFTYNMISDEDEIFQSITGARIVDKSMHQNHKIKFEFWFNFKKEDSAEKYVKLQDKILNIFKAVGLNIEFKDLFYKAH